MYLRQLCLSITNSVSCISPTERSVQTFVQTSCQDSVLIQNIIYRVGFESHICMNADSKLSCRCKNNTDEEHFCDLCTAFFRYVLVLNIMLEPDNILHALYRTNFTFVISPYTIAYMLSDKVCTCCRIKCINVNVSKNNYT